MKKAAIMALVMLTTAVFLFGIFGVEAQAAGLVDDTVNAANEYSKYPLGNYQLDFYVDNSWGWLPWNWSDGIGKQVNYGLYAMTDFLWHINLFVSNATGYLVHEAYSLDFIQGAANAIGESMQAIAGVTTRGLSSDGFYAGFLLLIILAVGVYVGYVGLIKKETTKATSAVVNFVVIFVLSAAFIAYSPDYIGKINEFSADISNASLSVGTKIVLPESETQGRESVDLIRDSLFSIQVKQPWLLLQFDDSNVEAIGADRVEQLLSTSPDSNNGEDREGIVKSEIEDRGNTNLTITKTVSRLGMVFFLILFNLLISAFVFLLTGTMIFSQVLFIIYAMLLPVSFILSMIPTFDGMTKRAVTKLFNTILMRAGITLIITIAFSISTMLYRLSGDYPFFLIAFLQVVVFAGIYFKLGDLMSMFSLQGNDSQGLGRQMMRRPRMFMNRHLRRFNRNFLRSSAAVAGGTVGAADKASRGRSPSAKGATHTRSKWQSLGVIPSVQESDTPAFGSVPLSGPQSPTSHRNKRHGFSVSRDEEAQSVVSASPQVRPTIVTIAGKESGGKGVGSVAPVHERPATLVLHDRPAPKLRKPPAMPIHERPATADRGLQKRAGAPKTEPPTRNRPDIAKTQKPLDGNISGVDTTVRVKSNYLPVKKRASDRNHTRNRPVPQAKVVQKEGQEPEGQAVTLPKAEREPGWSTKTDKPSAAVSEARKPGEKG